MQPLWGLRCAAPMRFCRSRSAAPARRAREEGWGCRWAPSLTPVVAMALPPLAEALANCPVTRLEVAVEGRRGTRRRARDVHQLDGLAGAAVRAGWFRVRTGVRHGVRGGEAAAAGVLLSLPPRLSCTTAPLHPVPKYALYLRPVDAFRVGLDSRCPLHTHEASAPQAPATDASSWVRRQPARIRT